MRLGAGEGLNRASSPSTRGGRGPGVCGVSLCALGANDAVERPARAQCRRKNKTR